MIISDGFASLCNPFLPVVRGETACIIRLTHDAEFSRNAHLDGENSLTAAVQPQKSFCGEKRPDVTVIVEIKSFHLIPITFPAMTPECVTLMYRTRDRREPSDHDRRTINALTLHKLV